MKPRKLITLLVVSVAVAASSLAQPMGASAQVRIFNTVKQKLSEGRQVIGGTVSTADPDIYCAVANSGFDFTWIEMQHSPLTYTDVARMIWACRDAPAIPFIRFPVGSCRAPLLKSSICWTMYGTVRPVRSDDSGWPRPDIRWHEPQAIASPSPLTTTSGGVGC